MAEHNAPVEKALELANLGDLEEASELIGKLLEEYPDNIEALDVLGEILTLKGEYKEAIIHLEKTLANPPIPVE